LHPPYSYLLVRGSFVQLDNYNPKYLPIFSRDVLKRIAEGDDTWDEMVPPQVADIIRSRGFFAYKKRYCSAGLRRRIQSTALMLYFAYGSNMHAGQMKE